MNWWWWSLWIPYLFLTTPWRNLIIKKSIARLGLQSFAVCPSGPTEYCGRNWLSSHLMALGLAQQGCNRSGSVLFCLTYNSLERPQRHWISLPESMKKTNRLNQVYHIKDTRNCTKSTTSHVKWTAVQKKAETTQMHPGIDVLKGVDIWTTSTQRHQWRPPLTHP